MLSFFIFPLDKIIFSCYNNISGDVSDETDCPAILSTQFDLNRLGQLEPSGRKSVGSNRGECGVFAMASSEANCATVTRFFLLN